MVTRSSFLAAAGAVLALVASPAAAQDEGGDLRVRVGLGAQTTPEYPGADDNEFGPLFDLSFSRGAEPFDFDAPGDSFGIDLVSTGGFSFGPVLNLQNSRKNSDVGAPVGKVPTTIEAGAFAEFQASDAIRVRGEVRRGIGGHDGIISSLGADYIWRDADNYLFSIGPRLLLSDSRYQRAYFGVTPEAALATGLPVYRPDGGFHAIGAESSVYYAFNPTWGIFGYGRYERLIGDARRSPIVREFGSPNQFSAGLGVTYTFTMSK